MRHTLRALTAGLALATLALCASPAWADVVARPRSYHYVTRGAQYVFVMLAPFTIDEEANWWLAPVPSERVAKDRAQEAARVRTLRSKYAKSGLYRNDGSSVPLWTVEWYSERVDVASDGVHLVRHGPWASSRDEEGLSFFARGAPIATYAIHDLVDAPWLLERTVSHFFWEKEARYDDSAGVYSLATLDNNQFDFDVRTGKIIRQWRPVRAIEVGALAVALGLLAWSLRGRRHARKA